MLCVARAIAFRSCRFCVASGSRRAILRVAVELLGDLFQKGAD
jgi:hypothetical protein